jgi:Gamma-glutamyltranspeptidase
MSPRLPRANASASELHVLEAARSVLTRGHAVDAVVAGVFAAAASSASVLLGPVQILVGGGGTGLHAVDGRVQQPGKGLPRPRGFVADEEIPDAAQVGVPVLVAALTTALASFGSVPLARALAPAIDLARKASKTRLKLLQRIAERGQRAMTEARLGGELVLAAGRGQGGLLSERDLDELRPVVTRAMTTDGAGADDSLSTVPWGGAAVRGTGPQATSSDRTRVVAAADARGQMAIACYEVAEEGLRVESLELVMPLLAVPVLRGRTRVRPGTPCPAAAPIALCKALGALDLAAGMGAVPDAEKALAAWLGEFRSARAALGAASDGPDEGLVGVVRVARGVEALSPESREPA